MFFLARHVDCFFLWGEGRGVEIKFLFLFDSRCVYICVSFFVVKKEKKKKKKKKTSYVSGGNFSISFFGEKVFPFSGTP